jgi:outer membrane protein OmpA-like peptidoglycan-associated protein
MTIQKRQAVIIALIVLVFSTCALAGDVNELYRNFMSALKNDQTAKLEALVRSDPKTAAQCLAIIQKKMRGEEDKQRAHGYEIVAEEIEELIGITSKRRNCPLAEKVYQRGLRTAIPEEKLKKFSRVVKLCPSNGAAYVELGEISRKKGTFDEAVKSYEKALHIQKSSSKALLGLGETFLNAGLYRRSLPYFEKVLAADPGGTRAKKLMEQAETEIAKDNPGLLLAPEIIDRLGTEQENLMCMCPQVSRLQSRLRLHQVTFSPSSITLTSRAKRQLEEVATALKSDPLKSGTYIIDGHADNTGSKVYNQSLSMRRAGAAMQYLVTTGGVDSSILSAVGAGDSRSWTTNKTKAGRQENRRIEILRVGSSEP